MTSFVPALALGAMLCLQGATATAAIAATGSTGETGPSPVSALITNLAPAFDEEGLVYRVKDDLALSLPSGETDSRRLLAAIVAAAGLRITKVGGLLVIGHFELKDRIEGVLPAPKAGSTLTLAGKDLPVGEVLRAAARSAEQGLVCAGDLRDTVSLRVKDADPWTVIRAVCQVCAYRLVFHEGLLFVTRVSGRKLMERDAAALAVIRGDASPSGGAGSARGGLVREERALSAWELECAALERRLSKLESQDAPAPGRPVAIERGPMLRGGGRSGFGMSEEETERELAGMGLLSDARVSAQAAERERQEGLKIVTRLRGLNEAYTALQRGERLGAEALRNYYLEGKTPKQMLDELSRRMDEERSKFAEVNERYKKAKESAEKCANDFTSWRKNR